MSSKPLPTLDTQALLARRDAMREATTSGNVGAFPVPLAAHAGPMRRQIPEVDYQIPPEYGPLFGR